MTVIVLYAVAVLVIFSAVLVAALKDTWLAKVAARASAARPSRWQ
jgi:hypothetical protein